MSDNKPYVSKIIIEHKIDEYPDLSYLGSFSNKPGAYPIEHNGGLRAYPYFNADNVDDLTQAEQNYDRMMMFENGNVYMMGIIAEAQILIPIGNGSFSIQTITSSGLYGIESDSDKAYIKEIEAEQLDELKGYLKQLNIEVPDDIEIDYKD